MKDPNCAKDSDEMLTLADSIPARLSCLLVPRLSLKDCIDACSCLVRKFACDPSVTGCFCRFFPVRYCVSGADAAAYFFFTRSLFDECHFGFRDRRLQRGWTGGRGVYLDRYGDHGAA